MTRVHSHLHVYTAIPQIIIQNVIIRAVKYGSNQRTRSIAGLILNLVCVFSFIHDAGFAQNRQLKPAKTRTRDRDRSSCCRGRHPGAWVKLTQQTSLPAGAQAGLPTWVPGLELARGRGRLGRLGRRRSWQRFKYTLH